MLYPEEVGAPQRKRKAAAKTSYRLKLLRRHGVITKLNETRRYRITRKGQQLCMVAAMSQKATIEALTKAAA